MLDKSIYPKIQEMQPEMFFQLDGAPAHWGLNVRAFLNEHFPDRRIGRGGPILWPPRSPDLTPLDFFLWGFVKSQVYRTPVRNVANLKVRIRHAVASINRFMLTNCWKELKQRLHRLTENGGRHVEVFRNEE